MVWEPTRCGWRAGLEHEYWRPARPTMPPSCAELGASEIIDYTTTRFEDVVVVEPSGEQLRQISALVDAGQLRPIIDQVFPLPEARHAYEAGATGHRHGKIVLTIGERSPAT